MQTYIADIIPSLQRFSKKLNDLTKLSQQHWVSIDDSTNVKRVFIFREKNELLIFENGVRNENNSWRYLDNQSIEIKVKETYFLMNHAFLDEVVLALKISGGNEYAFFVNETKYGRNFETHSEIISYLELKYKDENEKKIETPISEPIEKDMGKNDTIFFLLLFFILLVSLLHSFFN